MEKLTVSRIGQAKTIPYNDKKTGEAKTFQKIGFQTNEYGDRWFDITFRDSVPVEVGKSYDFEVTEREYKGKTYYDAKLPKGTFQRNGPDVARMTELENKITTLTLRFNKLMQVLVEKGVLEMPEPKKETIPGTTVEYPSDEIDPKDIPFD